MSEPAACVQLEGLTKRYGSVVAADAVDLDLDPGEFVSVLGPSGSGKSTILGLVSGALAPDHGHVRVDGRDIVGLPPADRKLGIVFQHYALFPHMSVARNVAYGLERRRWTRERIRQRVAEMLALVGLEGMGDRRPHQLSGGQQQRVALARALAFSPRLLLMDEPLAALDREIRVQMRTEIRRIHAELRPTVLYVTHDRDEAFALSSRVAIMRDGRLVRDAPPTAIYRDPRSEFVAHFFCGYQIVRPDHVAAGPAGRWRVSWAGYEAELTQPAGAEGPLLALPPAAVTLNGDGLHATVEDVVPMGPRTQVHCRMARNGLQLTAEMAAWQAADVEVGTAVSVGIDLGQAMLVGEGVTGGVPLSGGGRGEAQPARAIAADERRA
jgi:putative spermidine/putrescine transport system ATP-binding protein